MVFGPVSASMSGTISHSTLTLVGPNPTAGRVEIQYAVARQGRVRLELLDVSGRVVATLANGEREPGRYGVAWDRGDRLSAGLYFVRLVAPDGTAVTKVAAIQ